MQLRLWNGLKVIFSNFAPQKAPPKGFASTQSFYDAVWKGDVIEVEAMLKLGVNPNERDGMRRAAMEWFIEGYTKFTQSEDIDEGRTYTQVLHRRAQYLKTAQMLVDAGAEIGHLGSQIKKLPRPQNERNTVRDYLAGQFYLQWKKKSQQQAQPASF